MSSGAAFDEYLQRLAVERSYSAHTLAAYRTDLEQLDRLREDRPWSGIDEQDVRRWVAVASREGLAARSIARRLSSWRGFFDWLARQGQAPANPARGVRAPKAPRRLPKALSPDDARALFRAPDSGPGEHENTFEASRDQALLELLYSCGLRLSELTSLDTHYVELKGAAPPYRSMSWFSRDEAEVSLLGKGGKRRTVPVGRLALSALDRWLALREAWLDELAATGSGRRARRGEDAASTRTPALFINARGTRLSNRTVQERVKRLALRQGIPANVHPHVLRHSFASHLLQSSGDLRAVQELLGHASIATTQVYTSLDFQRLAAVYDAAHPRARRKSAG